MNPRRGRVRQIAAQRGTALLEVLLAVALFVAAAAVMTVALNASLSSLNRQRLAAQASNMAASVLAEVQLGIRPMAVVARAPMEPPYAQWLLELAVTPAETGAGEPTGAAQVEVILRHQTESVVQRLAQLLPLNRSGGGTNSVTASSAVSGATPGEH